MTLAAYLEKSHDEAPRWPGGRATWKMLRLVLQGVNVASFGGAAREALLNCYAVLHDLARTTSDAELREEAARYLGEVANTLRTISGKDP